MAHRVEYLTNDGTWEWRESVLEYEQYKISALRVGENTWAKEEYVTLPLYVDPNTGNVTTNVELYERSLGYGKD